MSFGIVVRALDAAGGSQLGGGQRMMLVDHQPVVVLGDPVTPHGKPPHAGGVQMVQGSGWMRINRIPVCRAGHLASCGHASSGRDWFQIPG